MEKIGKEYLNLLENLKLSVYIDGKRFLIQMFLNPRKEDLEQKKKMN
jgi:hypothetical protein